MNIHEKAAIRNTYSALRYEAITFTAGRYDSTPTPGIVNAAPFKGLHVTNFGDVEIEGVDGQSVIFTLTPGCWPYGGNAIIEAGTTSTGLIALY